MFLSKSELMCLLECADIPFHLPLFSTLRCGTVTQRRKPKLWGGYSTIILVSPSSGTIVTRLLVRGNQWTILLIPWSSFLSCNLVAQRLIWHRVGPLLPDLIPARNYYSTLHQASKSFAALAQEHCRDHNQALQPGICQ